jgi:hypothetical protein
MLYCQPPTKIVAPELAFVIIQQQIGKYPQNAKSPWAAVLLVGMSEAFPCDQ